MGRTVMLSIWQRKVPMVHADTQKVKDRGPWLAARSSPGCRRLCGWRATVPHEGCGVTFQKALALPHQGTEP